MTTVHVRLHDESFPVNKVLAGGDRDRLLGHKCQQSSLDRERLSCLNKKNYCLIFIVMTTAVVIRILIFPSSLFSHRTVTAWCSTSSSLAGRPTGTLLSPSAPSSSWSGGWRSGRSSTTEETGGLWFTACKFDTKHATHRQHKPVMK